MGTSRAAGGLCSRSLQKSPEVPLGILKRATEEKSEVDEDCSLEQLSIIVACCGRAAAGSAARRGLTIVGGGQNHLFVPLVEV